MTAEEEGGPPTHFRKGGGRRRRRRRGGSPKGAEEGKDSSGIRRSLRIEGVQGGR